MAECSCQIVRCCLKKDAHILYILFRNFAFSEQDFWQTFGGYLIALRPKWKIGIFGTELSSQETAALLLDQQNGKFYAVQKTISGCYADSIRSLCLRIECADTEDAAMVNLLCQHMDWQSGILVADWDLREAFEREYIPWLHQSTCYCYGNLSEDQEQQDYLDVLSFPQKVGLWLQFLENGIDYEEFAWIYCSHRSKIIPFFSMALATTPSWIVGRSSRPRSAWLR